MQNHLKIFALIFFLCPVSLWAQPVIQLNQAANDIDLTPYVYILEDESGALDLQSILARTDQFKPTNKESLNFGYLNSAVWTKIKLRNINPMSRTQWLVEMSYPLVDFVDIYVFRGEALIKTVKTGDMRPFENRPILHRTFTVPIPEGTTDTISIYFRIASNGAIEFPLRLWTESDFNESVHDEQFIFGNYYGSMGIMVLFNLLIFITLRDRSYLYYVLFITFYSLFQGTLNGLAFEYLWPSFPWFGNQALIIFMITTVLAGFKFSDTFLNLKERVPKLHQVFKFITYVILVLLVVSPFLPYRISVQTAVFSALLMLLFFPAAFLSWRSGYRPAGIFLLAWTTFLVGILIYILKNIGIIPANFVTNYAIQIGSALEALLLSIALADRINVLKWELNQTESEKIRIERQQIIDKQKFIEEQNVKLEEEVLFRTQELTFKNKELETALRDLKNAQLQLVQSEKMASLGQLTAGIAHEINNPINFQYLSLPSLEMDLSELRDYVIKLEDQLAKTDAGHDFVSTLQREYNISELNEEIDHLLKGIKDGAVRTASIVKNLQNFSRLEEETKLYRLTEGIDATLNLAHNILKTRVKVHKLFDPIPEVECIPGQINQVFMNMIMNAADAIKERGDIFINVYPENDGVMVKIRDTGVGMDDKLISRIFDPFFTTKPVGQGTGLGLSIAYKIIQDHKGSIDVSSEPGKGTSFFVWLPLKQISHV